MAAHRESIVNLILRCLSLHVDGGRHAELAQTAASCLRAVLRGSSNDGGGKTAVGVGERGAELAVTVADGLAALDSAGWRYTVGWVCLGFVSDGAY